jgi:hypothetical protein
MSLPPLLTVKEVAAALRLDPATVYRPRSAATSTPSA